MSVVGNTPQVLRQSAGELPGGVDSGILAALEPAGDELLHFLPFIREDVVEGDEIADPFDDLGFCVRADLRRLRLNVGVLGRT